MPITNDIQVDSAPFLKLLSHPTDIQRLMESIESAIERSFQDALLYTIPTQAEVRRRFSLCEKWFRRARGDLGLSLEKTLDLMYHALVLALDGKEFSTDMMQTEMYGPT